MKNTHQTRYVVTLDKDGKRVRLAPGEELEETSKTKKKPAKASKEE